MVILVLERVPPGLRGELTRWMLEPKSGVFVGTPSAMVRDKLWERICGNTRGGAGMMIYSSDTEQGYAFRLHGDTSRTIVNLEGLSLVRVPPKESRTSRSRTKSTPLDEALPDGDSESSPDAPAPQPTGE